MIHTVCYASTRGEVWSWYWRAWRHDLWRFHLTVFAVASLSVVIVLTSREPIRLADLLLVLAVGFLCVAWMPLYPMVMFKPQVRTLELDDQGLTTTIGKTIG